MLAVVLVGCTVVHDSILYLHSYIRGPYLMLNIFCFQLRDLIPTESMIQSICKQLSDAIHMNSFKVQAEK